MSDVIAPSSRIKIPWLIGTLAAFAIFALIAAYSSRMTDDYPDFDQQRAQARYATLAKIRDEANKTLSSTAWVDQDKGTVRIPIEDAMAKEVDTLKSKPAAIGAAIPGTAPAPAPASTNAAPTAASALASTNAAPATPAKPAQKTPGKPATPGKPVKPTSGNN